MASVATNSNIPRPTTGTAGSHPNLAKSNAKDQHNDDGKKPTKHRIPKRQSPTDAQPIKSYSSKTSPAESVGSREDPSSAESKPSSNGKDRGKRNRVAEKRVVGFGSAIGRTTQISNGTGPKNPDGTCRVKKPSGPKDNNTQSTRSANIKPRVTTTKTGSGMTFRSLLEERRALESELKYKDDLYSEEKSKAEILHKRFEELDKLSVENQENNEKLTYENRDMIGRIDTLENELSSCRNTLLDGGLDPISKEESVNKSQVDEKVQVFQDRVTNLNDLIESRFEEQDVLLQSLD